VVSFTLLSLYHREYRPKYPMDRRLGGTQSLYGSCGEEKNRTRFVQPVTRRYTDEDTETKSYTKVMFSSCVKPYCETKFQQDASMYTIPYRSHTPTSRVDVRHGSLHYL
jgi:hypothetical protein